MPAPAPLVPSPADVTPEWLTSVLVASGRVPAGARVTDLAREVIGRGKVGQNVRFHLSWAGDDDVPASVVGKFASEDPVSRQGGLLTGTYLREVSFYRHLGERVAMSVPRCHAAELDPASGAFVLLFDDVHPAETGDQVAGCSVDEAALAMEELARLHAGFWGDASIEDDTWLVRRGHDGGQALAALYAMFVGPFLERFGDRLSPTAADVAERLTPLVGAWIASDARQPLTLLHADYRLENMLFGRAPGVPPLTTVDWQTPNIGAGPSDAAYFLGGSLPTDARRGHERDLLDVYRQGLHAAGVELEADACFHAYRCNAVAGVHMTVVAACLVGQDEHGDEMFLAMIERAVAHADDLGTLDALA